MKLGKSAFIYSKMYMEMMSCHNYVLLSYIYFVRVMNELKMANDIVKKSKKLAIEHLNDN